MSVNGKATFLSRKTRIISICCAVISLAFLATFVAGIHLQDVTKITNLVIPVYSAVLGTHTKPGRNVTAGVTADAHGSAAGELADRGNDDGGRDDTMQIRRGVAALGSTVQSGHYILKSDCEEKIKLMSVSSAPASDNQTSFKKGDENIGTAGFYKHRVNAVVLAAMRTGSSFIGELLARRNDFIYLFEPGLRIQNILKLKQLNDVVLMTKYLELLDGVFRCNFTNLDYFLTYSSSLTYEQQKKHIPGLMDSKTCHYYRKDKHNKTKRYCATITRGAAERKCAEKKSIGMKIIRIHDINLLLPLVLDTDVNLKVIHLVRDPRGMVASRLMLYYHKRKSTFNSMYYGTAMRDIVEEYCKTRLKTVEIGRYVKELRKNYLLIRYEDAAVDPFETARKIYSFLGLEGGKIPATVAEWLLNNTHNTNPKSSPYSTQRDSKATAEQWRSKLTYEMIKKIENTKYCRDMMKASGYRSIYDGKDLKNTNFSYALKLPAYNSRKYDEYFPFS